MYKWDNKPVEPANTTDCVDLTPTEGTADRCQSVRMEAAMRFSHWEPCNDHAPSFTRAHRQTDGSSISIVSYGRRRSRIVNVYSAIDEKYPSVFIITRAESKKKEYRRKMQLFDLSPVVISFGISVFQHLELLSLITSFFRLSTLGICL